MVFAKESKFLKQVEEIISSHICLKIPEPVDFFVAIPTLADESVFEIIESLRIANIPDGKRVSVVVLVNDSENTPEQMKEINNKILERFEKSGYCKGISICGNLSIYVRSLRNIPQNIAGVGFVRRVLMDEAICVFTRELKKTKSQSAIEFLKEKFIFSLDSDCTVSPDYFERALEFLEKTKADFGIFLFEHRLSEDPKAKIAGILWELFLRYWRDSLKVAGYPFAYYPIGSLFVFRGYLYPIIGRISLRKAGEDFYFLQKVLHSFQVIDIPAFVFPKAEPSSRTPFGTGYEILQYISGNESRLKYVWNYRSFKIIEQVIKGNEPEEFIKFLNSEPKYKLQIENIRQHSGQNFKRNFVKWFNPFKVLKFLRFLESIYPKSPIDSEIQKLINDINQQNLLDLSLADEFFSTKENENFEVRILKFLNILRTFDMKISFLL